MKLIGKLWLTLGISVLATTIIVSLGLLRWLETRALDQRHDDLLRASVLLSEIARPTLTGEAEPARLQEREVETFYDPDEVTYGTPVKGSQTYERAVAAHKHIVQEISMLCAVIEAHGQQDDEGRTLILFGDLFEVYSNISDKVVGMLLRARKHKLLYFEGETLFQRQDDDVPILLFYPADVATAMLEEEGISSGAISSHG